MPFWLKKSDFFIRTVSSHRLRDAGRSSGVFGRKFLHRNARNLFCIILLDEFMFCIFNFCMEGLVLRFVANHFDVVPVRTNDESCIVVYVVVRAQTRRTIVFATRLYSRTIKSFDLLAIFGCECQMKMRRLLLGLADAQ
jgi:hypothetical protein